MTGSPAMRGNKITHQMKSAGKREASYRSEDTVRGTGESGEASWVDNAVGVILVASQVVTGSKVTTPCGVRRNVSVRFYIMMRT